MLKPQDVFILLKLSVLDDENWTYGNLASSVHMSASEVHKGIKRANCAGLIDLDDKTVNREALFAFLSSGVQYAFYPERGRITRGMPTGLAARPSNYASSNLENTAVWPDKYGNTKGYALKPLYKSVPNAAKEDPKLYNLLALTDAIRDGEPRERDFAIGVLKRELVG